MRFKFLMAMILALTLCLFWGSVFSATTGKISGRVVDAESGEPLPGANVIITGTQMGAATDLEGYYFIINVRPGRYTLSCSMMGYETTRKTDVPVTVDRTTSIDFDLETTVIEAGAEVTVVAERAIIPLDVANTQSVVDPERIEDTAFKTIEDVVTAQVGIEGTARPSIRGSAYREAAFIVDGLMLVDEISNLPYFKVPLSSIQEVQVITGGFNAEYGNVRSGVINVVTKEGADNYSGTLEFSYSPPALKHFGPHIYGTNSALVRPFVNPDAGMWTGNAFFPGWYSYSGVEVDENGNPLYDDNGNFRLGENGTLKPGNPHYGKPYENLALYLWRHRSMDNLNMLRDLVDKGLVDVDLSRVSDDDAVFEYGDIPDLNGNFSFGGPLPFLNNVKFFTSYSMQTMEYVKTAPEDYADHNASLKLTTQLTDAIKLNVNFRYGYQKGFGGSIGPRPDRAGPFISNDPYTWHGGNKIWYPNCTVAGERDRYFSGFTLTHVLSPKTFYEFTFSHQYMEYNMLQNWRNTQGIAGYDDRTWLDQGRIGTTQEIAEWSDSNNPNYKHDYENWSNWARVNIGGYWYDESPWGYVGPQFRDLTGNYRMGSCQVAVDQSFTRTYMAKGAITSQMNRFNQVKVGFEFFHDRIHQHFEGINPSVNGGNTIFAFQKPVRGAVYAQDKLEFGGMIANVGLRLDVLNTGEVITLDGDVDDPVNGPFSRYTRAGYQDSLYTPNWTSHFKAYLSPRVGISHPISTTAKIFFNYGHFYQWPTLQELYQFNRNTRRGSRLDYIPSYNVGAPKTIQYEVGYAHNLFNLMELRLTGYYKDISDEIEQDRYYYLDGTFYRTWDNQRYKDIRGFEVALDMRHGQFISGWLTYNYMVNSVGRYGFDRYYEDPNEIPRRVSSAINQAEVRPIIKANIAFHTPSAFGPEIAGFYPLDGIDLSLLYFWQEGEKFTWNPNNIPYVENNVQWKPYQKTDLRFTKRLFRWKGIEPIFFIDAFNVFNNKNMEHSGEAWSGQRTFFKNEFKDYMFSLKLDEGDRPGDAKSEEKPYIDMPAFDSFLYFNKRDIFYGLRINFAL